MNIAEKLTAIAENEQKVFEAGKKSEYDHYWDIRQNYGNPQNYEQRFWGYPPVLFNPKYDFVCGGSSSYAANGTFRTSDITDIKKNVDVSQVIGTAGLMYTFYGCSCLVNARTVKVAKNTNYTDPFGGCSALEEVRFEGEIGQNGLSFANSPKLSHDSLMSIINHLYDYASNGGGSYSVTFGTTNLAKLTDAEKAVATQKGWTLA